MAIGRIPEPGTGIPESIIAAKGDILTGTANDTPAVLSVGTNGHTLVADSAEATGLKWAAPAGGGKVLQVVSATSSTETTVSGTSYADSGLSATITPTSATSKILVLVDQLTHVFRAGSVGASILTQIVRTSTSIYNSQSVRFIDSGATDVDFACRVGMVYLDSPSTTSATTYKTQIAGTSGTTTVKAQYDNKICSITLLEIGA
jgi:hypothetical protein